MGELTDADLIGRIGAIEALLADLKADLQARVRPIEPSAADPLAWGARVSATFRERVRWICFGDGPGAEFGGLFPYDGADDDLMTCMAWESGRTFSPSIANMAGSGATGLIQFMPKTARDLGTSTSALAKMTAENQLNYVYKYFLPFKDRIHSLSDLYMAILWPAAVGKPDDYILFSSGVAYRQNAGLDANRDNKITKAETAAKLYAMRAEGLRPENIA